MLRRIVHPESNGFARSFQPRRRDGYSSPFGQKWYPDGTDLSKRLDDLGPAAERILLLQQGGDAEPQFLGQLILAPVGDDYPELALERERLATRRAVVEVVLDRGESLGRELTVHEEVHRGDGLVTSMR